MSIAVIASAIALIVLFWHSVGARGWYRQKNRFFVRRLMFVSRYLEDNEWERPIRKFEPGGDEDA